MKMRKFLNGVLACTMALSMVTMTSAMDSCNEPSTSTLSEGILAQYKDNVFFEDGVPTFYGSAGDVVDLGDNKIVFESPEFSRNIREGTYYDGRTNIEFAVSGLNMGGFYTVYVRNDHESDNLYMSTANLDQAQTVHYRVLVTPGQTIARPLELPTAKRNFALYLRSSVSFDKEINAYVSGEAGYEYFSVQGLHIE